MNNLHDLFLLMFNLSQMSDKAKVIEFFHESISELFKPHQFVYSEQQKPDSIYSEEISTRNFFYGYLLSDSEPTLETRRLVQNAVQMLAVILDRLNLEAELQDKVDSLETISQQQLTKITSYVEELEIARLASLNLIEDLKEEIKERKQTETELKRSETLLNETQRITKIGGWEYDVLTDKNYFSDEIFNIYGIAKDEKLDPEEALKFYPPDDRTIVSDCFTKAIAQGEPYDIEVRFINARSENLWVRTAGKPVLENGKVVKVIGTLMDITERKQAEEALFKTTEQLEHIGKMARIGGWELDLATTQVEFSRETARIHEVDFPYVPPKLSQGNEFYPPEVWPDVQATVQAAIEHGTAYDREWPFITAKGNRIWVRVQGFCVKENGKTIKLQGTFQDITKRKHSEEENQKQLDELRRWYEVTLDREGRVLQLKQEVNELLKQWGEPLRYGSTTTDNPELENLPTDLE